MKKKIRLVIVDDHEILRKTWKMVLEREERIEVVAECSSGIEAIECAGKDKPDIILMDVNMHPVNGFEATRKICLAHPSIGIIGMSINNQPTYARNIMQLGARGYVTKNSPSEEMIKAIIIVYEGGTYICRDMKERMMGHI